MSIVNDQFTILILIQFCRPNYYTIIFLIPTIIISKKLYSIFKHLLCTTIRRIPYETKKNGNFFTHGLFVLWSLWWLYQVFI